MNNWVCKARKCKRTLRFSIVVLIINKSLNTQWIQSLIVVQMSSGAVIREVVRHLTGWCEGWWSCRLSNTCYHRNPWIAEGGGLIVPVYLWVTVIASGSSSVGSSSCVTPAVRWFKHWLMHCRGGVSPFWTCRWIWGRGTDVPWVCLSSIVERWCAVRVCFRHGGQFNRRLDVNRKGIHLNILTVGQRCELFCRHCPHHLSSRRELETSTQQALVLLHGSLSTFWHFFQLWSWLRVAKGLIKELGVAAKPVHIAFTIDFLNDLLVIVVS